MKRIIVFSICVFPFVVFGEDPTHAVEAVAEVEVGFSDIFSQAIKAIESWRSLGWQVGLSGVLAVFISTLKNSFIRRWVWDRLGWSKVLVAPALSLIIVILSVKPLTFSAVILAIFVGAGAIFIHEMLDSLKDAPFVKRPYNKVIEILASLLKKPKNG